tara:strand:+ start:106 stop:300 length:195 start_codon:yes stop_codon:yes gene_type:complete
VKVTISERKEDGSMTKVVIQGVVIDVEGDDVDEMVVRAELSFNGNGMLDSLNGVYRIWIEEGLR